MKKKSIREEISRIQNNVISQFPMLRIAVGLCAGMLIGATPAFSAGGAAVSGEIVSGFSPLNAPSDAFKERFNKQKGRYSNQDKFLSNFLIGGFSFSEIWDAWFGKMKWDEEEIATNAEEVQLEPARDDDFMHNGEENLVQNDACQDEQINKQEIAVLADDPSNETDLLESQEMLSENAETMMADLQTTCLDPYLVNATLNDPISLRTAIGRAAKTPNQVAIAAQLDGIVNPTFAQNLLLNAMINDPLSEISEALDSLSGYQYTNDLFTTEFVSRQFLRRLYNPIRSRVTYCHNRKGDSCQDWTSWVEAGGTHVCLNNSKNARSFNMQGYEITAGMQKLFACDLTLGVAGSYENDHFHYKHGDGSGDSETWLGGIYGLYRPADYYGLIDFAYGESANKVHRKIAIGPMNYSAYGKPDTSQFAFYGEVGVDFLLCNCLVQPFGGIQVDWCRRKKIAETSSDGIGLALHKKEWSSASSRIGLHLTSCSLDSLFNVSLDLAWNARLTSFDNKIQGKFAEFGNDFEIEGTKLDRNSIDYAVTISTNLCNGWEVYLEGSGESWNKAQLYNLLGGVKFSW